MPDLHAAAEDPLADSDAARAVDAAIASRRSLRAFLPMPVARETVARILTIAARAPSGTNMQPWRVHVLAGIARQKFCDAVVAAFLHGAPDDAREYAYYPTPFFEPFLSRRRKVGWDLYTLLGIARGEDARMRAQHARNFRFFDAPVGMIFTIDRRLAIGSWLDYGMFLQNIMVAARGRGLDTCPQAAFSEFPNTVRAALGLSGDHAVICGMALGHADHSAVENTLRTEREAVDDFTTFAGFG